MSKLMTIVIKYYIKDINKNTQEFLNFADDLE